MWRKILREMGKTDSKLLQKTCLKLAKRTPFYRVQKTIAVGLNFLAKLSCRSTGRLTSQRSFLWSLGLPVNHPIDRTQVLTCRLTGRSTKARTREQSSLADRPVGRSGPDSESELSGSVDRPVDRPSSQDCVHVLCTSIDRSVDRLL